MSPSNFHWLKVDFKQKKKKNTNITTWAFQTLIKCNPSSSLLDRKNQKLWQTFAAASLSLKICIISLIFGKTTRKCSPFLTPIHHV